MSRVRVVEKELKMEDKSFFALDLEMKNADVVFFSEEETQLGTLAVALPQTQEMIGLPLSSVLLGDRNVALTRVFAEQFAQKTKKIALVSVFTRTLNERDAGSIFMKLVKMLAETEEAPKKRVSREKQAFQRRK